MSTGIQKKSRRVAQDGRSSIENYLISQKSPFIESNSTFLRKSQPRYQQEHQIQRAKYNPKNIWLRSEQRMSLGERFPGYYKLENGYLCCSNEEELSSQSGIIIELFQRAGQQFMEGKGILVVSLPVRIFEKRSTIFERICDLWCLGPQYLKQAALLQYLESDPVKQMQQVIRSCQVGMHMVSCMRKPFNPIHGETYQGVWPDGTRIYNEHVSHDPHITCFLVEHPQKLFVFEGSYEYTARIADLESSATGRQVGKTRVRFQNGGYIKFEFPFMKISELQFGAIEFTYKKFGLSAKLEFSKEGKNQINGWRWTVIKYYLPIDCFEGSVVKDGVEMSKFSGSWLENIQFDGQIQITFGSQRHAIVQGLQLLKLVYLLIVGLERILLLLVLEIYSQLRLEIIKNQGYKDMIED